MITYIAPHGMILMVALFPDKLNFHPDNKFGILSITVTCLMDNHISGRDIKDFEDLSTGQVA